ARSNAAAGRTAPVMSPTARSGAAARYRTAAQAFAGSAAARSANAARRASSPGGAGAGNPVAAPATSPTRSVQPSLAVATARPSALNATADVAAGIKPTGFQPSVAHSRTASPSAAARTRPSGLKAGTAVGAHQPGGLAGSTAAAARDFTSVTDTVSTSGPAWA